MLCLVLCAPLAPSAGGLDAGRRPYAPTCTRPADGIFAIRGVYGLHARAVQHLRGGNVEDERFAENDKADMTPAEAQALLDAAGTDEKSLIATLCDYRQSAQVQKQGCQRVIAAFKASATNETESEAVRRAYLSASGAKVVFDSLRMHAKKGERDLELLVPVCEALAELLNGPPNHAAKGDDMWDEDCDATPMRTECGRSGAVQLALELISTQVDALQEDTAAADPPALSALLIAAAYKVLERLLMDYENKVSEHSVAC